MDWLSHSSVTVDSNTFNHRHPNSRGPNSSLKGPQRIARNSGYSMEIRSTARLLPVSSDDKRWRQLQHQSRLTRGKNRIPCTARKMDARKDGSKTQAIIWKAWPTARRSFMWAVKRRAGTAVFRTDTRNHLINVIKEGAEHRRMAFWPLIGCPSRCWAVAFLSLWCVSCSRHTSKHMAPVDRTCLTLCWRANGFRWTSYLIVGALAGCVLSVSTGPTYAALRWLCSPLPTLLTHSIKEEIKDQTGTESRALHRRGNPMALWLCSENEWEKKQTIHWAGSRVCYDLFPIKTRWYFCWIELTSNGKIQFSNKRAVI